MRRATWILWLMLALLPLRGWAVASMGLPQSLPASMNAQHRALPPCHQADEGSQAGSSCQACDACHGALAAPPNIEAPAVPVLRDEPAAIAHRDTGRALIDGLERPPRNDLA